MRDKKYFLEQLDLSEIKPEEVQLISPLVLAYIGDAVYEIYVRIYIFHKYGGSAHQLHKIATRFVNAGAQAKITHALENELEEDEWTMIKRGRNQKSHSAPKHANLVDYKYATGFETLIGYLYLRKKIERLEKIIQRSMEIIEDKSH
jgi:ribonuclease-3 family protein